jgi:exosome complex component RRP42
MGEEGIEITPYVTAERIREYLEKDGKRFDGRRTDEYRELTIEKNISNKAEGSVRVKLGKTEVIVGVKMDVGAPYPDSADKGNLMVTAEFLPMSSSRIELGPPKFDSIELGRIIDRGIRESKLIELEKLCIKEGEKVWTVFVDIYTINDDGNLLDAAGIGAVAALKIAKVPKYDEEKGRTDYHETTGNIPLKKMSPFAITVHKIGNKLILDPTREEEDVSETRITVGSSDGVIYSLQKGNSHYFSVEEIGESFNIVEKAWKELFKKVEAQLK